MILGAVVYFLGARPIIAKKAMLLRGYISGRKKLLLWSGVCFTGLALSNSLIFVDLVLVPDVDLYRWRLATAAIAMVILLYGLIWESD